MGGRKLLCLLPPEYHKKLLQYYVFCLLSVCCLWTNIRDKFYSIRSMHSMCFCRHLAAFAHVLCPTIPSEAQNHSMEDGGNNAWSGTCHKDNKQGEWGIQNIVSLSEYIEEYFMISWWRLTQQSPTAHEPT